MEPKAGTGPATHALRVNNFFNVYEDPKIVSGHTGQFISFQYSNLPTSQVENSKTSCKNLCFSNKL